MPKRTRWPRRPRNLRKTALFLSQRNFTPISWLMVPRLSPTDMRGNTYTMRTVTFRDALREAIREEMLHDERVFIMGKDIAGYGGTYGVTKGLIEEFGEKR